MKRFWIFTVSFLLVGIFSITAQDLVILRDGSIIEAQVTEMSPTEIRYRRYDHLTGPVIVIPTANVLSIRFANGTVEIITPGVVPGQPDTRDRQPSGSTAINSDRTNIGFSANPAGFLVSGPSIGLELIRGRFYTDINLMFPSVGLLSGDGVVGGFGGLVTLNYFHHTKNGGAYVGGGIGYVRHRYEFGWWTWSEDIIRFGLNAGYRFVTSSGLFFRTGGFAGLGYNFDWEETEFFFQPDLAIGFSF